MRLLDVFISFLTLLLLMPFFCLILIILRFTGEGEIFYRQNRIGRCGITFKVIKFATMLKDSLNMGFGSITSKNDHRILPFGKFLRKTKINELPQLVNVFLGDMSLIGPRPHVERDLLGILKKDLDRIQTMRPGLSGLGSLVFRNEEEILNNFEEPRNFYDNVIAPYKAKLEVWYFENKTFTINVLLIILTLYVILTGHNKVLYQLFRTLPPIPEQLKPWL